MKKEEFRALAQDILKMCMEISQDSVSSMIFEYSASVDGIFVTFYKNGQKNNRADWSGHAYKGHNPNYPATYGKISYANGSYLEISAENLYKLVEKTYKEVMQKTVEWTKEYINYIEKNNGGIKK